ncbi:hypothetical protein GGR58DRAFT_460300 [Xylaria digitata]|nr:hypothetical protein GGR58DRAFT_460300 [Xylaria digitata]
MSRGPVFSTGTRPRKRPKPTPQILTLSESDESSKGEDDHDHESGDTHNSGADKLNEGSTPDISWVYSIANFKKLCKIPSDSSHDMNLGRENQFRPHNGSLRGVIDGVLCVFTPYGSSSHVNTIDPWYPYRIYPAHFRWDCCDSIFSEPHCRRLSHWPPSYPSDTFLGPKVGAHCSALGKRGREE